MHERGTKAALAVMPREREDICFVCRWLADNEKTFLEAAEKYIVK